jgi:hypothetical protein
MDIAIILTKMYPNSEWSLIDNNYENLIWYSNDPKPSLEDLQSSWNSVHASLLWDKFRNKRNGLLLESDWTQVEDATVDKVAWAAYRQALRDLPQNTIDPENPIWPIPPE